ncbi:MAG TPA: RDD family protein [Cyclobacteriaceae bacterium]|nr:RDD family protein [Cyclobacteriaceae bacterium]
MRNSPLLVFALFLLSQFLYWFFSIKQNLISGTETLVITFFIGFFLVMFYVGYRWARWVTIVLMVLMGLVITSMTLEGFGNEFLIVTMLYVIVIIMISKNQLVVEKKSSQFEGTIDAPIDIHLFVKPEVKNGFHIDGEVYKYPLLLKRYQSVLIDGLLVFTILIVTMVIMDDSPSRQTVMVSLGVLLGLGYEPLFTCYSATIGQRIMGIRVRRIDNPNERINIFHAYIRLLVKLTLGWLSFLTINFNPHHRAIHDIAGSSVVVKVNKE